MLLDKLAFTENKYEELSVKISDPSIMANQKEWRKLCKEHADLEIIVTAYREYKKVVEDLEANKEMLEEETDKEMKEMLSEEISSLKEQEEELEKKIQILLLPKILTMIKTYLLKSEVELVEMKRHYLQLIFSECIQDMRNLKDGQLN